MEHNPLPTSQADQVPGPFITYQCYPSISILSLDLSRERKLLFLFHSVKTAFPEESCVTCICFRVCPSSIIYWGKKMIGSIALVTHFPFASLELLSDQPLSFPVVCNPVFFFTPTPYC